MKHTVLIDRPTGFGVYLLDSEDSGRMPCHPRNIDPSRVMNAFNDETRGRLARRVVGPSVAHNGWVGIVLHNLVPNIFSNKEYESEMKEIQRMAEEGLLEIVPRFAGWLSIFNPLWPQLICPTPKLVQLVLDYQNPEDSRAA